jgi:hypothetical protein
MTLTTEATIAVIAAVVATIPVALSLWKYWRSANGGSPTEGETSSTFFLIRFAYSSSESV